MNKTKFKEWLEKENLGNQDIINEFAEKLKASQYPFHELEWASKVYTAAARLSLYKRILNGFCKTETPFTIEELREDLIKKVLSKAEYGSRSTCPLANLTRDEELAACAHLIDQLKYKTFLE